MNHSDVYWVALRLAGLIAAFKAVFDFVAVASISSYLVYKWFDTHAGDCASYVPELTSMSIFIPALVKVLCFGVLAYYCLVKGEKVHALLMRLSVSNRP